MQEEDFDIYIDRLTDGKTQEISQEISPSFIDVCEEELKFQVPVHIEGEAHVAQDTLVLRLSIETQATMPCSICNQEMQIKIEISDSYFSEEIASIAHGVFNYKALLRESILLEVPLTAECDGSCKERENMAHLLKNKQNKDQIYPFADL